MTTPCGFLSVRKPAGVTSTQCVRIVRKLFDTKQVGHGGTLDPMATGVLIMALGKATRVLPHLTTGKEYRGVIRFGVTTDTDDITGEILTKRAARWLTPALVDATLQRFVGKIDQMPPRISAIKRDGVRLYHLIRANKPVNITPRRVSVSQIQLQKLTGGDFPEATVHVVCGAGTYIRSIARECGEALLVPRELEDSTCELRNLAGELCVGGTLTELERSRSGAFEASASLDFDEIRDKLDRGESPLQTVDSVLQHLPFAVLPPMKAQHWLNCGIVSIAVEDVLVAAKGQTAPKQHAALVHGEPIRVFGASSPELLGISKVEQQDESQQRFILRKRIFI